MWVVESSRVSDWIAEMFNEDAYLAAWADGGIWIDYAPQETVGKMVLGAWQGGSDRKVAFGYSIFLIRAVAEGGTYDLVEPAADRIDELMMTTIPIDGLAYRDIRISKVDRDSPHQRKDAENGIPVVYLGKNYRIWYARPSAA